MTGAGNRCQCRCRTCKELPEGFKVLHPSTRKRHLAAEAKADSTIRTSPSPLPTSPSPSPPPPSRLHHPTHTSHPHKSSRNDQAPLAASAHDPSKLSSTPCCSSACPNEAVRKEAVKEAAEIRISGQREMEGQGKSTSEAIQQDDIGSFLLFSFDVLFALLISRCDS